jgi:starch phosphorylase
MQRPTAVETRPSVTAQLRQGVIDHAKYSIGSTVEKLGPLGILYATALTVRDLMVDGMLATEARCRKADAKRVYYLSMEFLMGRSLRNSLMNLQIWDDCREALEQLGHSIEDIEDAEVDAALGNGGLGRLAACFLDSLASLNYPGHGYGVNYEYGLFRQEIKNGRQVEKPDNWRTLATPWEIERPQNSVLVPVYGRIEHMYDRDGNYNPMWLDWKVVIGVPNDMLIPGYGGHTVNRLRLFSARASLELDMQIFNDGDYIHAVQQKVMSETISKVLYPTDSQISGKELRLIQEYFLTACALRDILREYSEAHDSLDQFADKVAIQLNDTHPTLAIAELMRLLIDENDYSWEKAWDITTRVFAYTNHTLMGEALEKWPVPLFEYVLPRHLQIVYEINRRFLETVSARWPGDAGKLQRMSIIEESNPKQIRMAHLAIVGSHSVNGVAEVHSQLVRTNLVPDFAALWPERFNNKTNGVTFRRWLLDANPELARLISDSIGPDWICDADRLHELEPLATDADFQSQFRKIKKRNKERLAAIVSENLGVALDCDALFDVQVKRVHEYKRQLLNILHVAYQYLRLVDDGVPPKQPHVSLFAGKAAPGYYAAKEIIRLINDVANVINNDRRAAGLLQVAFIPDYRVTLAEAIIPSADLSEQISTAGTEASGTSNMKFALNGALTIGTLDGANIEIREEVGPENIFIFGATVEEVARMRAPNAYRPWEIAQANPGIQRVLDAFASGRFAPRNGNHAWVRDRLLDPHEPYFHIGDFVSYIAAHEQAATVYANAASWTQKAILNVARVGKFSSDRTIREYAEDIWDIRPVK